MSAALSPDGKTVAAAGNGLVCFFDVGTGQEKCYRYPTSEKPRWWNQASNVKFSADGSRIALVGEDSKLHVFTVKGRAGIAELVARFGGLSGVAFRRIIRLY